MEGDRSGPVAEVLRLLQEANALRPRPIPLVLLENVEGLLSSREGADARHILESLGALSYGVDLLLIDAARFLPQSRRRVFVVGRWGGREHPSPPQPFAHPFRPSRVEAFVRRNPHLPWSFLPLPPAPLERALALEEALEADGGVDWFPRERAQKELARLRGPSLEKFRRALQRAQETGRPVPLPAYRRTQEGGVSLELRDDGLAGCLRVPAGGSSRQLLVEARPDGAVGVRFLTPQEYARLQGVPQGF